MARGDLVQLVTATGTLNPVTNVQVGCQVSGRVSKLYVDWNSQVTAGEVIAEIDPSTYKAAVDQAAADLANAKANLELQQAEAERALDLFTNKLISQSDRDTAVATLDEADATVKIKEAALTNAVANLGYCKIYSPVDGVVILRAVDVGQTVASSFNTPTLFQIANDLRQMQIDSSVAEADVGGVQEGQSVDFTVDAYPTRTFAGSVRQVRNSPTTVNNVVTYDCVISVTNSDLKLKPGMTANVSIIVAERTNVLSIPNSALRFHPPDYAGADTNMAWALSATNQPNLASAASQPGHHGHGGEHPIYHTVFLLTAQGSDPKLQPVRIQTGISDGISTEVLSGLDEGATVVIRPDSDRPAIGSGQQSKPARKQPAAALNHRRNPVVQNHPVIKLDDIHKTYHTGEVDVHAVRGISLEIFPGEFVAIMGSSGSGKSTLMNMIGALDRPTGGHYWLDGIDVSTLGPRRAGRRAQRENRLCVSRFQPACRARRRWKMSRCPCSTTGAASRRTSSTGAPLLPSNWSAWATARGPSSQPAFRRPATARGHRPRAGEPAHAAAGRRTDRQPRQPDEHRNHGRVPEIERPGHHHHHGHARTGHRALHQTHGDFARRSKSSPTKLVAESADRGFGIGQIAPGAAGGAIARKR